MLLLLINIIFFFCLEICVGVTSSFQVCNTTIEGSTWSFYVDEDVVIPGILSADTCFEECVKDGVCKAYTWLSDTNYCYMFKDQRAIHTCDDCISGTVPEDIEGSCTDHILAVVETESIDGCMKVCSEDNECNAYTWWDSSSLHPYACFLYPDCQNQLPCDKCFSGKNICIFQLPSQCYDYMVLDKPDRSAASANIACFYDYYDGSDYAFEDCWSDSLGSYDGFDCNTSPDWRGDGNYRLMEPAGVMIPSFDPGFAHCGGVTGIYLNITHPTAIGEVVETNICGNGDCDTPEFPVTVTNCNNFYVYHLIDLGEHCGARYCSYNPISENSK